MNTVKNDSVTDEIFRIKEELGSALCIPAHHYQRPEIISAADLVGDSYRLAVDVANSDAEYIAFCGVRFMAEGAAVLAGDNQRIFMPVPEASCPMADMITEAQAEKALSVLKKLHPDGVAPLVYMNAYADLKAFCGRHGGAVCTSSNAEKMLSSYFSRDNAVFFFPDQHLGINTALNMGIEPGRIMMIKSDFSVVSAAGGEGLPEHAAIFVWDGYCPVHRAFTPEQIARKRRSEKYVKVISHPEVPTETAAGSDFTGSTQQIWNRIMESGPGSVWSVGTELSFVKRLTEEAAKKGVRVMPLSESVCTDMSATRTEDLLAALRIIRGLYRGEPLPAGAEKLIVSVDPQTRLHAAKALNEMIRIVEGRD